MRLDHGQPPVGRSSAPGCASAGILRRMAAGTRYTKVIKLVKEAEDLVRSGAVVLDDGDAAIYFLWGQPSHAYIQVGDERIEGDAALKEIALSLAHPGKASWRSKDVLQTETLRCTGEELRGVLASMAHAGAAPSAGRALETSNLRAVGETAWEGLEQRQGPALRYSLSEFPLLPSGPTLWSDVPTNVVHLDVLIGTLKTVLVVLEAPSVRAAGVVHEGERYDAIYIDSSGVVEGRVAWEKMIAQNDGLVSAYEIEPDVLKTLPVLWRNRIVHRDLDKSWINKDEFLGSQCGDAEDRAVIVTTPEVIGIALFSQGRAVGTYTTASRTPRSDIFVIQALLAEEGEGRLTVLERLPEDVGDAYRVEAPSEAPQDEPAATAGEAYGFQPLDDTYAAPEGSGDAAEGLGAAVGEDEPTEAKGGDEADADTEPRVVESLSFMPPGTGVALTDFATMLSGRSELSSGPELPPPTGKRRSKAGSAAGGASAPARRRGDVKPAPSVPPDFAAILADLVKIGHRFVGDDFAMLEAMLTAAPRTPAGLRSAISTIRRSQVPNQSPEIVVSMARAMLLYVADRLTAV